MRIRLADPAARHRRLAGRIEPAVLEVLRSGRYVGGPIVAECERALAAALGHLHGVGVGSGTEALWLILRALDLRGGRVAVPALSFFATTEAVLLAGAEPVFVDVLPDRPLLDPGQVPSDVDAVVLVHLFGMRCAAPEGHLVVSDAAQCAGWGHGRPEGVASALSLYPSKTLGAAGDGGAVLTDDAELAARVRRLGTHGQAVRDEHLEVGTTSRLDAVQAAVVLAQLEGLEEAAARRRAIADRYDAVCEALPRDARDPVHQYVLFSDDREELMAHLDAAGIDSAVYYPHPMDTQPAVGGWRTSDCPHAARYARRALSVPVHEELSEADVERVLEALGR